jgi:methionine aminopeptidase
MEQVIKTGDVTKITTHSTGGRGLAYLTMFVHHELTPEREAELIAFVETAMLVAVKGWAAS